MRFLKWLLFAMFFTLVYYIFSALVYAANQTEATFNRLAIGYFVILVLAFIFFYLELDELKGNQQKKKVKPKRLTPEEEKAKEKADRRNTLIILAIALPCAVWMTIHIVSCLP